MKRHLAVLSVLVFASCCWASTPAARDRDEAEYYAAAYARYYGVPLNLVRSIVQQESGWHPCAISPKGAVGLMQIMPQTAQRLGVQNRCNIKENVYGGVRYLAWLNHKFHGDLRLVAAAYYAGEQVIAKRGLNYRNSDVVIYVSQVRAIYERQRTGRANERLMLERAKKSK